MINVYEGKMDSVAEWWVQWKAFMFSTPVTIKVGCPQGSACAGAVSPAAPLSSHSPEP